MAQTDNSYLADKVYLRLNHIPAREPLRVLDCFGGRGLVWRWVRQLSGREIRRLPIDIREDVGFALPGDNRAYLQTLDLSIFDVIDLDAYGAPCEQLAMVFERGFQGIIFATFVQSREGILPSRLLFDLGYTQEMIDKIPTVFMCNGWDKFCDWLALWGVRRVVHRSHARKHYLMFNCAEVSAGGSHTPSGGRIANPF